MSDTPRTDAAIFAVDVAFVSHDGLASEPKEVVEPEFARQLEHENVALRADVLEQCMLIAKGSEREYSLRGRIEQLERENAALRAADQIDISALRRENAALRSLIDDPNAMHSHYLRECNGWEVWQAERIRQFQDASEQLEQLERENAALWADKERLDWLARNRSVSASERPLLVTPESLRAAIDAARKEAQP